MPKVKIEVYEGGSPSATISIPIWPVEDAANLLPETAHRHLELNQIAELLRNPATSSNLIRLKTTVAAIGSSFSIVDDTR